MKISPLETIKIGCAEKFFDALNKNVKNDKVKYHKVDSYSTMMSIVK